MTYPDYTEAFRTRLTFAIGGRMSVWRASIEGGYLSGRAGGVRLLGGGGPGDRQWVVRFISWPGGEPVEIRHIENARHGAWGPPSWDPLP